MNVDRLATFVAELGLHDVGAAAIDHAKLIVRDTLGTLLAGVAQPENAAAAAAAGKIGGPGAATVAGSGVRTTPHIAALVNATAAVTLELDEGNQFAVNHPSVHVLPAALAVGEDRGATGAEALEAFIAGYETAVRLGGATRLRDDVHPSGTTAVVGAAAAPARTQGRRRRHAAGGWDDDRLIPIGGQHRGHRPQPLHGADGAQRRTGRDAARRRVHRRARGVRARVRPRPRHGMVGVGSRM